MDELHPALTERAAVCDATRFLEGGEPERALHLLRKVRLTRPEPAASVGDPAQLKRLRTYIEQAIEEIEIDYPGHALRTLRAAAGSGKPLG